MICPDYQIKGTRNLVESRPHSSHPFDFDHVPLFAHVLDSANQPIRGGDRALAQ